MHFSRFCHDTSAWFHGWNPSDFIMNILWISYATWVGFAPHEIRRISWNPADFMVKSARFQWNLPPFHHVKSAGLSFVHSGLLTVFFCKTNTDIHERTRSTTECCIFFIRTKVVWYIIFNFLWLLEWSQKTLWNHLHVWRGVLPHHMKPCQRGI